LDKLRAGREEEKKWWQFTCPRPSWSTPPSSADPCSQTNCQRAGPLRGHSRSIPERSGPAARLPSPLHGGPLVEERGGAETPLPVPPQFQRSRRLSYSSYSKSVDGRPLRHGLPSEWLSITELAVFRVPRATPLGSRSLVRSASSTAFFSERL